MLSPRVSLRGITPRAQRDVTEPRAAALNAVESPSIVPDLTTLRDLVEQYAAADKWDVEDARARLDEEERAIVSRFPAYRRFVHAAVQGAKYVRRQAKSGAKARSNENRVRNIEMATECIKRRRDPGYDAYSDTWLMESVGKLDRFKAGKTAAIKGIKDGLSDSGNQSRLLESAKHRRPDKRRSIFDGSK
jgi:hypothetical protein